MPENQELESKCQQRFGPILREIARVLGEISADGDEQVMHWFVEHLAGLVQISTEMMLGKQIDMNGGSPTQH